VSFKDVPALLIDFTAAVLVIIFFFAALFGLAAILPSFCMKIVILTLLSGFGKWLSTNTIHCNDFY
jgi:hypothetical protein